MRLSTTITGAFCLCHISSAGARKIVFPPVAAIETPYHLGGHPSMVRNSYTEHNLQQHIATGGLPNDIEHAHDSDHHDDEGDDEDNFDNLPLWSETVYHGLSTFANLPWEPCLYNASSLASQNLPYDIAILGAPFDTSTTGRPGARFGPSGIRRGSQRIAPHGAWDQYTGFNSFLSWARIVDCGDAPLTFLDNTVALKQLVNAHKVISRRKANSTDRSSVPRIITLGGDHTTTLAALRSTVNHWGPVSVIHFDSHIDTWDPDVLGGGLSHYAGVNHGTFLHIAHEEGLLLNQSNLHVGIRAPVINHKHDWKNDKRCGFEIITARDFDRLGAQGIIDNIRARVGDTNVYITVDIDVLDPAYAPGTGTAEVGGWTTRELLTILDGLEGLKVIGADVVEVAPAYDNQGETTLLAAAGVAQSLLALMVATSVKPVSDL